MVKVLQILRLASGALLIAVLFVPFAFYNTMAELYLSGAIWGFMLPTLCCRSLRYRCNRLSSVKVVEKTGARLSFDFNWHFNGTFFMAVS
jgi:hypothetical protein